METSDQQKVRTTCFRVSLLMEHQDILPDLKELVAELSSPSNSEEYMKGAHDALNYLIGFLEQKGNR